MAAGETSATDKTGGTVSITSGVSTDDFSGHVIISPGDGNVNGPGYNGATLIYVDEAARTGAAPHMAVGTSVGVELKTANTIFKINNGETFFTSTDKTRVLTGGLQVTGGATVLGTGLVVPVSGGTFDAGLKVTATGLTVSDTGGRHHGRRRHCHGWP